jgi:hypothetical protein
MDIKNNIKIKAKISRYLDLTLLLLSIFINKDSFSQDGLSLEWVAVYSGPFSVEYVKDIVVDQLENVYITTSSFDTTTGDDYELIKYDLNGSEQWSVRFAGPGLSWDQPTDLALDIASNIYVTGKSEAFGAGYDILTFKFDSCGSEKWRATFNGPANGNDSGVEIAVDDSGNVYLAGITGILDSIQYQINCVILKYNSQGDELWRVFYPGQPTQLILSDSGNVILTGYIYSDSTNFDYITIKYNLHGDLKWANHFNNIGNDDDCATHVVVDDSENVYVTGFSSRPQFTYEDITTIKYDRHGYQKWITQYNGSLNFDDFPCGITIDQAGYIYVSGTTSLSTFNDYFVVIKYNQHGVQKWINFYNGPSDTYGTAREMLIDSKANIFVLGSVRPYYTGNEDLALVKFDSSGIQRAATTYSSYPNTRDFAVAVGLDQLDNIYVTSYGENQDSGWAKSFTLKYNQLSSDILNNQFQISDSPIVYQNYPNPFNSFTTIQYFIPFSGHVTLKIFNILGQEIYTLVDKIQSAGQYILSWNCTNISSGVYLYSLEWNNHSHIRKLLILK